MMSGQLITPDGAAVIVVDLIDKFDFLCLSLSTVNIQLKNFRNVSLNALKKIM